MAKREDILRKAKEKGRAYLAKGKLEKALAEFQKVAELDNDVRNRQKVGDILAKIGKDDEAIAIYRECATEYGEKGFLVQAISVTKLILDIDPACEDVKRELNELYAARGITGKRQPRKEQDSKQEVQPEEVKAQSATESKTEPQKSLQPDLPIFTTPLFSDLTPEEFPRVVERFQVGNVPKKTLIIKEGSEGDSMFLLAQGKVRVFKTSKSGRKVTLTHLEDGAFFGEFAFLTKSPRTASIETSEDSVLLRINRDDLESLIIEYPHIQDVMDEFYRKRILDTLLSISPLFEALEVDERRAVINQFEPENFGPDDVIIEEGEEGRGLFLIKSGQVEVSTEHPKEGRISLAKLNEGDFFGEIALLRNQKTTARVAAVNEVETMILPRESFQEVIMTYPQILEAVGSAVEDRVQSTIRTMTATLKNRHKEGLV